MRTQALQDLYLQKPVTTVVILCMIAVLPWIGMGDFSTKGEPREAAVAISMLETGDWILPQVYADEFAYKPPMAHWLMAAASYPQGYVSEFTSRLPSALACITLIGFVLFFFGERVRFQEAFIATLLLLTCIEIHRAGMTTRVDMLLTTFMVIGMFYLYRWENKLELKGLPVQIPILLGCAALTKGPVGIIIPLFVFGVYLLILNKYRFLTIFKAVLYIGISSLFLPALWYVAAWKRGGDDFLNLMLAENFGRFFHIRSETINYELGHKHGAWFNMVSLLTGFMPWSVFFVFSLLGLRIKMPGMTAKAFLRDTWDRIRNMEKVKLFALVAVVCFLFFYSIPSSKRSVYLMPAYPFIALFLAQYAIYLTEYRTKVTRIFAWVLATVTTAVLVIMVLVRTGAMDLVAMAGGMSAKESTLITIGAIEQACHDNDILTFCVLAANLIALGTLFYQIFRKINIKILYSTIFVVFAMNLLIDGVVMKSIRNYNSSKPFAARLKASYAIDRTNVYVMNNLREYGNSYGLNFYLGNIFRNFETTNPDNGYFLVLEPDFNKVLDKFGSHYNFRLLETSPTILNDVRHKVVFYEFTRNR